MTQTPLIDRHSSPQAVRRLLLLGGSLFVFAAVLALMGHAYGPIALLTIFAVLAMVGIAAIFAVALGLVQLTGRVADIGFAKVFLDSLPVGTVISDRKGRIVYANRAYGEATGARAVSEAKTLERLLSREPEASEAIYRLANLARRSEAGQEEFRLSRSLDGTLHASPRWYRTSVRAIPGEDGAFQAWQIADVTAERGEQETFFQNLQHAIDYLDHAPAGFFAADGEGRLAYINATLANWLGLDLTAFKPLTRRLSDFAGEEAMPFLLGDGDDLPDGSPRSFDGEFLRAGGQRFPVRLLSSAARAGGGAPDLRRVLVLNLSATGDEKVDALQAAETRFTRFFNSSPMAIAALDENGRVLRANAAFSRLFGATAAGGSIPIAEAVGSESRDSLRQVLGSAVRGSAQTLSVDAELAGEGGRSVRLYFSAVAREADESGEAALLYGVDITEQRALEDQYAKSQKMQAVGNLAGGIAHDFNNVLTIIIASVDFLLLNHRTGDPSFQDLLLIKQSANRAASLVRQLLAYSRRQTMRPKMLNLNDVVADMHLLLRRISGDVVKLERLHSRELWPVMADIGQFEQVLTNLVGNARDAMPDGGKITISTRNVPAAEIVAFNYAELVGGDYVLVEVADTGTGMPPDVAERIFEPFFTTKEIGKGTGLGLSMVYGIVKQSNGFIFVESKPGEGTTFRIFLPRHHQMDVPEKAEVASTQASGVSGGPGPAETAAPRDLSGHGKVILLVEDEDHVRAGNLRALKLRGYEVFEASSGVEALERMEEIDHIDLVVSDVVMPEMDGPTLLREARKMRPGLKFVFVSGYAEDAFSKNLDEGEAFGFLPKPFSLHELAVTVHENINGKA